LEGTTVAHYRVVDKLGGGGMGVVYRAEDTRLGRAVALKFLPERLARDAQALERFQREARAASALNHPNICVVYDVGEIEGQPFIAMELLEGRTLRQRIGGKPLPLDTLLELGAQIADALDAAHGKGILHRDLKPANLFVTERGQAKVLDFGLAKQGVREDATGLSSSPTVSAGQGPHTSPGTVVGTAAYMSPEQARGLPLDARSDLFSFGAVLYEMATGRSPFEGDTSAVVFDAILNRDPLPPSRLNPSLPGALDGIVLKALEKDRDVRYQTARDLLADLKRLRRDSGSGKRATVTGEATPAGASRELARAAPAWRRPALTAVAAVAFVALGIAGTRLVSPPSLARVTGYVPLTSDREHKVWPTTDGTRLYFGEWIDKDASRLAQVAVTGGAVSTIDTPLRSAVLSDVSPDGTRFLLVAMRETLGTAATPGELWTMSAAGGPPRPVGGLRASSSAAWSPDGTQIVYTLRSDVFVAAADGSAPRRVWTAPGAVGTPAWSPDGRRLRVTVKLDRRRGALWQVGLDGSRPQPLLPGFRLSACCGRWTPDGRYFVFQADDGLTSDIWALRERTPWLSRARPEPQRLTRGPLWFTTPVPSRDGKRLFVVGTKELGELVRYDPHAEQFVPYLSGISAQGLDFSPDGQWVAYVLYPEGTLWRSRSDGTEQLQLTFSPLVAALPRWSPDGRRIVFTGAAPEEPWRLRLVPAEGGPERSLLASADDQVDPTWSPDGRRIAFGGDISETGDLHVLDLETGEVSSIPGSTGLFSPRWSPDGRHLAALTYDSLHLRLFDFRERRWREIMASEQVISYPSWAEDGRSIVVSDGYTRLRLQVADGTRDVLARYADLRRAQGEFGQWVGQGPDGSVLAVRDASVQEVYALDWDAP
jgi:Tol biopolymer transport system component/predicted Ser/Thr protein kinase